MSTTFEKELRKIFDNKEFPESTRFFDTVCYVLINDDLRLKVEFAGGTSEFDGILLTVINKTQGCVDKTNISFKNILGVKAVPDNPNFKNGVVPKLYYDSYHKDLDWYAYTLNKNDLSKIRNIVIQYIDVYRDFTMEPTRKQSIRRQLSDNNTKSAPKKSIPKKEDISI